MWPGTPDTNSSVTPLDFLPPWTSAQLRLAEVFRTSTIFGLYFEHMHILLRISPSPPLNPVPSTKQGRPSSGLSVA